MCNALGPIQASALETDKDLANIEEEIVVCVSARSCGTRFVGAAAASVHSLLVGARPRPLRVSSLGAAPTRFWGMPTGARAMLVVTPKKLWRDHSFAEVAAFGGDVRAEVAKALTSPKLLD